MQRAFVVLLIFFCSACLVAAEKSVEDLVRQLGSGDFQEREQAIKDLVANGPKSLDSLRKALKNSDKEVARRAEECITIIERNAAVFSLIEKLKDPQPTVRAKAADGLIKLGPYAAPAVPALITTLKDPDARVAIRAARGLGHIGSEAKPGVPHMITLLRDPKAPMELCGSLVTALYMIGPDAIEATEVLLEFLDKQIPDLQNMAAAALGEIRPKEKRVVEALLAALKRNDLNLQANAAGALGRIQLEPSLCVPALIEMLKRHQGLKDFDDPRGAVLGALGRFGADAKPAIPLALELVKKHDVDDIHSHAHDALRMLRAMGPHARGAIPELQAILQKGPALDAAFEKELTKTLMAIGDTQP